MENNGYTQPEASRKGLWKLIDRMEGDKVIWIIVLLLMLISVLAIFSSTPLLSDESTRVDIMKKHGLIAIAGLGVIIGLYNIKKIGMFRFFSQYGFILSFILLSILVFNVDLGFIKAQTFNGARRTFGMFGLQIHVYEIVKVTMVMYLAWALHAFKQDSKAMEENQESPTLRLANRLAENKKLKFLKKPFWKRCMYIYCPTLIVCGMTAAGSNSSAIFVFLVLIGTMLIGGVPFRELFLAGAAVLVMAMCMFGIHKATGGEFMPRIKTFTSRMNASYDTEILDGYKIESREFYKARDKIKQPYGAKLAVHEGRLLGKGSGNSTQKYSVTHIYSDYMFSFLVEEYGLMGGILIIILYISLIARSSMIVRLCSNEFARIAIGGLAFLITGQAFMHMLVNVDIMPMTGQTLPLISDGASAFLSSCLAFGIILSISRMAKKKTQTLEEAVNFQTNDIQARMDILEQIDDENL
ncbi:MAG: FtsW/RodA/SpoVE family cell cycle protein [Bacteroidales bacterium]|nr:FtsW/RodA/SpoVE family cell cycle protein [Bacteroidales bacterium]